MKGSEKSSVFQHESKPEYSRGFFFHIKKVKMQKTLSLKEQGRLLYSISASNRPRLFIESGETIRVETEDAFSGQIRRDGDARDFSTIPYSNPLTGPIFVNGTKEGDTLAIQIQDIQPTINQGATRIVSSWYPAKYDALGIQKLLNADRTVPERPVICKISEGIVHFEEFGLPYSPMIGTIATADPVEAYLPWFSGPHGGNMDIAEVGVGSTLYLPVRVQGALLHLGDVHALQGEGELSGAAVEMPSMTTLRVSVAEKKILTKKINWPRLETQDALFAITATESGRTLEDAIRLAFTELLFWLEEDYGMNRWQVFELLSLVGKISLGNFWTVAAGLPKKFLPSSR